RRLSGGSSSGSPLPPVSRRAIRRADRRHSSERLRRGSVLLRRKVDQEAPHEGTSASTRRPSRGPVRSGLRLGDERPDGSFRHLPRRARPHAWTTPRVPPESNTVPAALPTLREPSRVPPQPAVVHSHSATR